MGENNRRMRKNEEMFSSQIKFLEHSSVCLGLPHSKNRGVIPDILYFHQVHAVDTELQ